MINIRNRFSYPVSFTVSSKTQAFRTAQDVMENFMVMGTSYKVEIEASGVGFYYETYPNNNNTIVNKFMIYRRLINPLYGQMGRLGI